MANIARDGAPKRTQTEFKSNQQHVPTPGLLTDISRTAASRILDGDRLGVVNDGGESGNYKAVNIAPKPAFGMNSERQKNASTDGGAQVLSEAIQSGSTRLKP
jgi:hypothetical protein